MNLQLLVVPYDSGQRGRRMGAGPERLIELGIESALTDDGHQVRTTLVELPAGSWTSEIGTAFELMRRVAAAIATNKEALPIILAGNCITTIGALATYPAARTGIVWFDAHGDFNTPDTTTSGFLDGTALSTITGGSWRQLALTVPGFKPLAEENVCVVGARDLDPTEKRMLRTSGVSTVAPSDFPSGLRNAMESMAKRVKRVHVHVDLDVLDAEVARANTYAVGGGLTIEQLESALSMIASISPIDGITLSAYDPSGDREAQAGRAAIRVVCAAARAAQGVESAAGFSTFLDRT